MFSLHAVGKTFGNGTKALDGISADIEPGEFIALLGPSGCGKSTLLRLLAGLDEPSSGRIVWNEARRPAAGDIGFVFQDATLLPWANAAENVFLPLRLRGMKKAEAEPLVTAALRQVGLGGFMNMRPKGLSGGMKMRVSIARALVGTPELLLMDEPFAALDEFTRHKLQDDLLALWRQSGKTIVFVTHSIYEASYLANRILILSPHPGRIVNDIRADLPEGPERRGSTAYNALVGDVTKCLQQIVPA